jgi:glycosyltransferase involved in cell wall biosynthesis
LRVLIDTTVAQRAPLSGTGVYVTRLCQALSARRDIELVTAANPRRRPVARAGVDGVRNLAADLWWTGQELPRLARQTGAELIHHPGPGRIPKDPGVPQVVTLHDLAFEVRPKDFDRGFRAYAHLAHRGAAQTARVIIAVTRTTAEDARELWGVPAERIVVAHHGPGQALRAGAAAGAGAGGGGRGRYFLYVGSQEPRKDLSTLLNAYSRYRLAAGERPADLLLAGSALGVAAPGVGRESDPDPSRLGELYAGALALVHPARYEGFGLTVLEAMALRVPVVAARSAAVVEVAGEAALMVDPGDPVELGAALIRVASEPALRARLSARGRERASGFSWARSAQRHVDAYALAVGRSGP